MTPPRDMGRRRRPGLPALLPGATLLGLLAVALVPGAVPGAARIAPFLPLSAVYFWSLHRPALLPSWAAFLAGLLQDILSGGPLGLFALLYLAAAELVTVQRRFLTEAPFSLIWAGFALLALLLAAVAWLLSGLALGALVPPGRLAAAAGLTAALYPVISWGLSALYRRAGAGT
jgi:rod shape-determining protein MreD